MPRGWTRAGCSADPDQPVVEPGTGPLANPEDSAATLAAGEKTTPPEAISTIVEAIPATVGAVVAAALGELAGRAAEAATASALRESDDAPAVGATGQPPGTGGPYGDDPYRTAQFRPPVDREALARRFAEELNRLVGAKMDSTPDPATRPPTPGPPGESRPHVPDAAEPPSGPEPRKPSGPAGSGAPPSKPQGSAPEGAAGVKPTGPSVEPAKTSPPPEFKPGTTKFDPADRGGAAAGLILGLVAGVFAAGVGLDLEGREQSGAFRMSPEQTRELEQQRSETRYQEFLEKGAEALTRHGIPTTPQQLEQQIQRSADENPSKGHDTIGPAPPADQTRIRLGY